MDNGMKFTPLFLAIGVIVALIAGFAAGGYFAGQQGNGAAAQDSGLALTLEDKNFIVNVANLQIDQIARATALQAVNLDWCTANGGVWNVNQRAAQVVVNSQVAAQLEQGGADVTQSQDGNWVANVAVLSRDVCIFPVKKGG